MEQDLREAQRFLDILAEGEPVTFQTFHDVKKPELLRLYPERYKAAHFSGHFDDCKDRLLMYQKAHHGVYVMVNEGDLKGRSTDNIIRVRALFLDLDGAPLAPVLASRLAPHIVVESSPGRFQVYWLVSNCPITRFRALQVALAWKFNGDPGVNDLPRIMRVPGFLHLKNPSQPFVVRILQTEACLPYDVDAIVEAFDLKEAEEKARRQQAELPSYDETLKRKLVEGERHPTLMNYATHYAKMGLCFSEVFALVQSLNLQACVPPKDLHEVRDMASYAAGKYPAVDLSKLLEKVNLSDDSLLKPELALPLDLINRAPGLVGRLAEYLTATNFYPQAAYSLAAALAFVGVIKGHSVATEDDCRTNIYTICIGFSGTGKTAITKKLNMLAKKAGVLHLMVGNPSSGAGLRASLYDAGGRAMLVWDEIGIGLNEMLNNRAPTYKREVIQQLMIIFSDANTVNRAPVTAGARQIKQKKTETIDPSKEDIDQPCLTLYGMSTPRAFFDAFTSAEAVNGLISRLLVFETHDYQLKRQYHAASPCTNSLVEEIRSIAHPKTSDAGNLAGLLERVPKIIPYSHEAEMVFHIASESFEAEKLAAINRMDETAISIWGRALEHAKKIALTCEDGEVISGEVAKWAIEVVGVLASKLLLLVGERVSDNQNQADIKKILRVLRQAGRAGISQRDFNRKTEDIDVNRKRAYLKSLVDDGTLTEFQVKEYRKPRQMLILTEFVEASAIMNNGDDSPPL